MSPPNKTSWVALLLDTLLSLLLRFPIMSSFIQKLAQKADARAESSAPLNTDGAKPESGVYEREVAELLALVKKPVFSLAEVPAIENAIISAFSGAGLDDRKMLLEKLIVSMSNAKDLAASLKVQQFLIALLYKDLPHPPSGYVCLPRTPSLPAHDANASRRSYVFRAPDGSNYNPLCPTMGMAGSPYARSVPSTNNAPKTALPDPGLVFDTLLKRDKFVPHPGGISSLFFAFADLVIHSIFNTDNTDPQINKASSYLDLSILYGNSQKDVDSIRRKDGTGRLYDDVFADYRLLMMPPAACALLVLLSRNHNFVAQRILAINEFETYSTSFPETEAGAEQKLEQDEEIFNRARLVNCGYFMQIILGDYVGAILGLVRDQSDWRLNPLMTIRAADHAFVPVGEGNVVSIEFNLLYRWHATLSEQDTKWFNEDVFKTSFPDKNPADLTPKDFVAVAHKIVRSQASSAPTTWTFDRLKRKGADGTGPFADADLARILQDATDYTAGAFKARGIPETLRVVELMAIEQSRSWGTCSLNEFRKFLGLKPYETFEQWNPDPSVHTAAAALYKDIDNLELHVGLQAEEAKTPQPGAGLCPGYTISRAILADAVCLTRGDRFMTVDFTPHNLTAWGYQDCQYDTQDGSFGGMLTKLLYRTLPDYYPKKSVYAHFPFLEPKKFKEELDEKHPGESAKYDWARPKPRLETITVQNFAHVKRVLEDTKVYKSSFENQMFTIVQPTLVPKASFGSLRRKLGRSKTDTEVLAVREAETKFTASTAKLSHAIFSRSAQEIPHSFKLTVQSLVKAKSISQIGSGATTHYVDIIRDVINLLPIYWLSEEVAGFPLKTEVHPQGLWYDSVTYDDFADVAEYIYCNFDPVNDWRLRESSQRTANKCIESIKNLVDKRWMPSNFDFPLLKQLWDEYGHKKANPAEFASQLFAATVPTAALYSQALANVIDFYLDDDRHSIREKIVDLDQSAENKSAEIMVYVYEALRLRPVTAGVYRTATQDDPEVAVGVHTGNIVFASLVDANTDAVVFGADALSPTFSATASKSVLLGFDHGFLSPAFFESTVPAVLGAVLGLKDLKRGPKNSGKLLSFTEKMHGAERVLYPSQRGLVNPWSESLILQYTAA
ncbi:hypothetical protein HYPSUDRAFT_46645 [Hypholoma sublateritium FD-334 SS-4]|uniref:Heme peroxidase n=1 Tax=Hypholoma sublateritium (strain FD-334 SS-4) TaxID=945553 RepID=A0A0D2KRF3_HYPSF|nr:hypothetical protein HYPSUDRAFT_46645 [Hypholoma sublateritium FD-334 SS-4]